MYLFLVDKVNLHGFASDPDDVRVEEWQGPGAVSALAQVVRRYPEIASCKRKADQVKWAPDIVPLVVDLDVIVGQ